MSIPRVAASKNLVPLAAETLDNAHRGPSNRLSCDSAGDGSELSPSSFSGACQTACVRAPRAIDAPGPGATQRTRSTGLLVHRQRANRSESTLSRRVDGARRWLRFIGGRIVSSDGRSADCDGRRVTWAASTTRLSGAVTIGAVACLPSLPTGRLEKWTHTTWRCARREQLALSRAARIGGWPGNRLSGNPRFCGGARIRRSPHGGKRVVRERRSHVSGLLGLRAWIAGGEFGNCAASWTAGVGDRGRAWLDRSGRGGCRVARGRGVGGVGEAVGASRCGTERFTGIVKRC